MTRPSLSFERDYFEEMYAEDPDPWGFDREWYERRKHALTVACLPVERARRALEPGCANGTLTELLADRCDELVAFELLPHVVERAASRLAGRDHVTVVQASFPEFWPEGTGDLVVWSEIAYYLTDEGLEVAERGLRRWLEPGGHVVAVHYSGATNYPRTAASVHAWLDALDGFERRTELRDERFVLGVWQAIAPAQPPSGMSEAASATRL